MRTMARRAPGLLSLLLVPMLAGTACANRGGGGSAAADDRPEVKIAFVADLTGDNSSLEIGPRNASELLVEQTNAKKNLPVRLTLVSEDTRGDKQAASNIAAKLGPDDKVVAVVGPGFSGESQGSGPVFEQFQIARVTPSATSPVLAQQGWKYWFRAVANDDVQGGLTPDVLLKYLKAKKVFIAHDDTDYGKTLGGIVETKLRATAPNVIAGVEQAERGRQDYRPLVQKAVDTGADVFYWSGYDSEAGLIVRQLKEKGFKGTFVGTDGSKGDNLLKGGGADANGTVLTCPCLDPNASEDASAKQFVADYETKFSKAPSIYAAEGHDATLIVIEAIRKAGAPSGDVRQYRQKVRDNIAATSGLVGLARTYAFEPSGELKGTPGLYLYRVEDGKYTLLGLAAEILK